VALLAYMRAAFSPKGIPVTDPVPLPIPARHEIERLISEAQQAIAAIADGTQTAVQGRGIRELTDCINELKLLLTTPPR